MSVPSRIVSMATFLEDILTFHYEEIGGIIYTNQQSIISCEFIHNIMDTTKPDYIHIEYTKINHDPEIKSFWLTAVLDINSDVVNSTVEEYNAVLGRIEDIYDISIESFTGGIIVYKEVP